MADPPKSQERGWEIIQAACDRAAALGKVLSLGCHGELPVQVGAGHLLLLEVLSPICAAVSWYL